MEDISQMLRSEHELTHRRLRAVLEEMEQGAEEYMRLSSSIGVGAGAGKTALDRHRVKYCRNHMVRLLSKLDTLLNQNLYHCTIHRHCFILFRTSSNLKLRR